MRTPAPPVDVAALVPAIAPYARTATRLHPRRGMPDVDASHVGGPVRWPTDQPWPLCDADLPGEDEVSVPQLYGGFLAVKTLPAVGARPLPHPEPNPMTVVAQLRVADMPGLWHPPGADVLQLLWCPFEHFHDHRRLPTPPVRLFWRRDDFAAPLADPPTGLADERFDPASCVLHPERVIEYPDLHDLPGELAAQIKGLRGQIDYAGELSTAPGWKVGGWSRTGGYPVDCDGCATAMRLLLTIDSNENDGGRWDPVDECQSGGQDERQRPTGVVFRRQRDFQIFVCTRCLDHRVW